MGACCLNIHVIRILKLFSLNEWPASVQTDYCRTSVHFHVEMSSSMFGMGAQSRHRWSKAIPARGMRFRSEIDMAFFFSLDDASLSLHCLFYTALNNIDWMICRLIGLHSPKLVCFKQRCRLKQYMVKVHRYEKICFFLVFFLDRTLCYYVKGNRHAPMLS